MKKPREHCPDCNSLQVFRPRTRPHSDGKIEIYIACTVCTFDQVLRVTTSEIQRLRARRARIEARARREAQFFGEAQDHTQQTIRDIDHEIARQERVLGR